MWQDSWCRNRARSATRVDKRTTISHGFIGLLIKLGFDLTELFEREPVPVVHPSNGLAMGESDGVADGAADDEVLDAGLQPKHGELDGVQLVAAHERPRGVGQPVRAEGSSPGNAGGVPQQVLL